MKTTMKKIAAYLLAMLLVLQMLPAMAENQTISGTQGPITSYRDKLKINAVTSTITVDMSIQLSITENYDKITWKSDNEDIATVDEDGVVTGVAPGQVKITATEDSHSDSITIRVVGSSSGEEGTGSSEKMVIIINGEKEKITYDGQEHKLSYTVACDSDNFDEDLLHLINESHLASGSACGVYQDELTIDDFFYEGSENVEFVITNGWLQIKPATVKIKANDAVQTGDERPEFTATVTGLAEGDDPETIQYKLEIYVAGDVTYITPVCESVQGNYRIVTEPGVLVIENGVYRAIKLSSDWPADQPAYAGTMITMTAELIGFENIDYTLQWQYSIDGKEWFNEPDANGTTFTFELNETTVQYTWRVVANY